VSYRGKLLVAHPNLKSTVFKKTVIYLYEDSQAGVSGVILNKSSDWGLDHIFEHKGFNYASEDFVYLGGPVNIQAITLLHTDDFYSANTVPVSGGVSISSDNFMFEKIATDNTPEQWRLFVGLSNWKIGQLDREISQHRAWLLADADLSIMFDYNGVEQWEKAIEHCSQCMVDSYFA